MESALAHARRHYLALELVSLSGRHRIPAPSAQINFPVRKSATIELTATGAPSPRSKLPFVFCSVGT